MKSNLALIFSLIISLRRTSDFQFFGLHILDVTHPHVDLVVKDDNDMLDFKKFLDVHIFKIGELEYPMFEKIKF